jgi:hypothetical protein
LLKLSVVEEDAPAVLALLQAHPLPVNGTHQSLAFRTRHPASIRLVARGRHSALPASEELLASHLETAALMRRQ